MQLINSRNEEGQIVPFSMEDRIYLPLLANNATLAIERGQMNREVILRMMRMAELHDPKETGPHVQRVGAIAAEIYQQWASKRGLDRKEIKHTRDLIRLAAMLHDVGKVGISDFILKKPGKLTDEEFDVMKWHTVYGARLFNAESSELDEMSYNIAINHHEKYNGGGYPGKITDIHSEEVKMGLPKKDKEIPLEAKITALADVYDALASRRSYKDPWPEEKILSIIQQDSGTHFDPEVVECFFEIFPIIRAIQEKYQG
jgi:response regulator RpfG family c-di-GMP phosphodiesterase